MCDICHSNPCRPQCPNAVDIPALRCEGCGDALYNGETYYQIGETILCEECIKKAKKEVVL